MKTRQKIPTNGSIHLPKIIPEMLFETITAGLSLLHMSMIGMIPLVSRYIALLPIIIKNKEVPIVPNPRAPSIIDLMLLPLEILAIKMPTNGPSPKNQAHINIVHAFENSDLPIGGGPRLMVKKFLAIKTTLS